MFLGRLLGGGQRFMAISLRPYDGSARPNVTQALQTRR
jgi:hypothetical protein